MIMPEFIESCIGFYLFVGFVAAMCDHGHRSTHRDEGSTNEEVHLFLTWVFFWPAVVYKFFKNREL